MALAAFYRERCALNAQSSPSGERNASLDAFIAQQEASRTAYQSTVDSTTDSNERSLLAFIDQQERLSRSSLDQAGSSNLSSSAVVSSEQPQSAVVLNDRSSFVIDELAYPASLEQERALDELVCADGKEPPCPTRTRDILAAARLSKAEASQMLAAQANAAPQPSVSMLAKSADVPRTTMLRWIRAMHAGQEVRRGRATLLKRSEERGLVALALTRQALNAPMTKVSLGHMARLILHARGKRFDTANEMPSPDWWERFLARWPILCMRKSCRLSADALTRATREILDPWFNLLQSLLKVVPDPSQWFNVDETHVRPAPEAEDVLAARGSKRVHAPKVSYNSHVTMVPCVSAAGRALPPLFVFEGKTVTSLMLQGGPPGAAIAVTDSGWMTAKLFLMYLQWLDRHLPAQRPVVLIVDQHESRFSEAALAFCAERQIILVALPPQLTSLLQPLDLTVYRNFKRRLASIFAASPSNLNRLNFVATITPAYRACFPAADDEKLASARKAGEQSAADVIRSGWETAGIFPYNPERVLSTEEVRKAELRSALQRSTPMMIDTDSSSSSSSNSSSSSSSAQNDRQLALPASNSVVASPSSSSSSSSNVSAAPTPSLSNFSPASNNSSAPIVASGERVSLFELAGRVAPIFTKEKKKKRKTRGFTSGAVLTEPAVRQSILDSQPSVSKASQHAVMWAPGMPQPSKPARARAKQPREAKDASEESEDEGEDWEMQEFGSSSRQRSRSAAVAKKTAAARPENRRIIDSDGDSPMNDSAQSSSSSSSSSSSAPSRALPQLSDSDESAVSLPSSAEPVQSLGDCGACAAPCTSWGGAVMVCDWCETPFHAACIGTRTSTRTRQARAFLCDACKPVSKKTRTK